ncbi:MAG: adenosylcobinamide amidohydrolase [Gemmatimonadetes bacterium]|nr:adenosylcobinamide amidohydrolase [Gemmatimonadota bacterium]
MVLPIALTPVHLSHAPNLLAVRFSAPHRTAGWAIVGGGIGEAAAVGWVAVRNAELGEDVDPAALLRDRLAAHGLRGAVGLLTSANLAAYTDVAREADGVSARCIATVGLGNALRAGDPPGVLTRVGTINVLLRMSVPLTDAALLETLALAAEARTLAVLEGGVASAASGRPATGTGTDCIVVAAPIGGAAIEYAGKHTLPGHLAGAAVEAAVREGVRRWQAEARQ